MPVKTEHYFLEAFIDGDAYLAVADKRRFSTIDNQLNRISEIIGDGRIDGWEIFASVFPKIIITLGSGLIDKHYINTFNDQIFDLSENGTFYVYAQRRIGMVGSQGPRTNIESISYIDTGAPLPPLDFQSTTADSNTVILEWTANVEPDLDHYDIEVSLDAIHYVAVASVGKDVTFYEDDVEEDDTYYYRILAVDQSGFKSSPALSNATTPLSSELPPNPIEVLMPLSEAAINVLWKRPPSLPFEKINQWKIIYVELETDGSEISETEESLFVDNLRYNDRIDDLTVGQRYKVTLKTVDTKGRESTGVSFNVTPQPTPAPRDPQGIVLDMVSAPSGLAVSGVQVNLNWRSGDGPYDPADSYRYTIYTTVDGQEESVGHNVPIGEAAEEIILYQIGSSFFSIPEQTLVTFRITSHDTAGFESFGSYIRRVTSVFSSATRLGNPQAEFNSNTGNITVTWDNQVDTNDVLIVVQDEDLDEGYLGDVSIINERIGKVELFLFDAELNHTYVINLTPFNADNISGPTSVVIELTIVAGELDPPEIPQNIELKTNDRQVRLSWVASLSGFTSGYKIYRMTGDIVLDFSLWTLIDTLPSDVLVFTDYGLTNDQIYSYYITATDVYGRESLHLVDDVFNLNFVEAIPKREGVLTEPTDLTVTLIGNNILLTWDTLLEEFDGFTIYRTIDNLHSWETIATVDRDILSYTDIELPLIDRTTFYYTIDKTVNDSDIVVQTTNIAPESSIFLGKIVHGATSLTSITVTDRRDIKDLLDPLAEYTSMFLLPHKHTGLGDDPTRIDLNPELVITDWSTIDGRIFTTSESDILGTGYIVKVDGRFPNVFFQVDPITRRLVFSEPIVAVDDTTGNVVGVVPEIEVKVLGIEEVQGVLPSFRFDEIHARQVQFGALSKEQLPDIDHEGRIREDLLPKRYLLERFSNHHFIVPQNNTDDTKTFGDGTTFYAVVASDGKIQEVIDFDLENDGALVGFRNPAFSPTTLSHLQQHEVIALLPGLHNNATQYVFNDDVMLLGDVLTNTLSYITSLSPIIEVEFEKADVINQPSHITFNPNNSTWLILRRRLANTNAELVTYDPATGDILSTKIVGNANQYLPSSNGRFDGVEYNNDNGIFYVVVAGSGGTRLLTLDPESTDAIISLTPVADEVTSGTPRVRSMAYNPDNNLMYGWDDNNNEIVTINMSTGAITGLGTDPGGSGNNIASFAYNTKTNKMYCSEGTTNLLREIDTDGNNVQSFSPALSANAGLGYAETGWLNNPTELRMGNYLGLRSDVFLRFPVNVPVDATPSVSKVFFTANGDSSTTGLSLQILLLDPSGFSATANLQFESIASVSTIDSIDWNPPTWVDGQVDSVDITALVKTFVAHADYTEGKHIIIKVQTVSNAAVVNNRVAYSFTDSTRAPYLETNHVFDLAEVNSNPGGFQSTKSYNFKFEFEDTDATRWVRITSFNTPIKPNPILNLKKRLRFRILNQFASIYLCVGIREITAIDVDVGDDGGTTGTIEWVGIGSTISDLDGNLTPVGTRLITASNDWQEIDIDLKKEEVVSFENGNAALGSDFGVLEHLAFTVNPDDVKGSGPFDIYIDKLEQVSDVLVSGTSQGILLSEDFGTSWTLSRLTDTPVHKFFRAKNNRFLWAISTSEVLLAVDPAFWFSTSGTTGVQYIRDIVEDNEGDIFISTDRGVYNLEIALIKTFASFKQTQPVNAFTTDCYGMYHNAVSSGIDEIWVSTEIGVYKTLNKGDSWIDTNMSTGGLVAYEMQNISTDPKIPNIIAINRKHVLRKLAVETDFTIVANFEEQHNIFDIWTMGYFSGRLYISNGKGVFMNSLAQLFSPGIDIPFVKVFPDLQFNNFIRLAFCLDPVDLGDFGEMLFIGQENRLASADASNTLSVRKEFINKSLPSFFVDNIIVEVGYIYNAFNGVVVFREQQQVNKLVSAAHLPRKTFFAIKGGWSQSNPSTDAFIFQNGFPKWLDFKYDDPDILGQLQVIKGQLENLPTLTSFNSLMPDSQTFKDAVLANIETITTGGEEGVSIINNTTVVQFMDNYTIFLSLVTQAIKTNNNLDLPRMQRTGIRREDRADSSRAALLEEKEGFESENSTAITINLVTGEVDFLSAFSQATTTQDRAKFTFNKYDRLAITIFNANVINTGEFTHRELEDKMENINTGLTSNLSNSAYTDLLKLGVFIDNRHNFAMDIYNVSGIQSRHYGAHNNDWYDILNSTIDYKLITKVNNVPEMRFVNVVVVFEDDPYFVDKLWIGTDRDIIQYTINASGDLIAEKILSPNSLGTSFVRDIFIFNTDEVYVVATDQKNQSHIYKTVNNGLTWSDEDVINLPDKIYSFRIISGVKVSLTEEGVFYSDNNFGTWFPGDVVPSDVLGEGSLSLTAFRQRMLNMALSTFIVVESDRWFFTSGSGIEFFAVGRLINNDATVVNKIKIFKGLTWVATDRGLYHDAKSLASDSVEFTLQVGMETTIAASSVVEINDIVSGVDALYCCSSKGKLYRFLDAGSGQEWLRYQVPDFGSIHKILLEERDDKHFMLVVSYNQLKVIDVTPNTGVFG